jgi:hypothetical protein
MSAGLSEKKRNPLSPVAPLILLLIFDPAFHSSTDFDWRG